MRPVIEKEKIGVRHIVYVLIIIICIIGIGTSVYLQFFQDSKLWVILGISTEEIDEELEELKSGFLNIFDNSTNILEEYTGSIEKRRDDWDIIIEAYDVEEQEENYTISAKIPYFNIDSDLAKEYNEEIKSTFKDKTDSIISSSSGNTKVVYNVKYKAYIKNEILSLVILSELKEGDSNERIIIETYNYNLSENREVTIAEILEEKEIDTKTANSRIEEEVNESQELNLKIAEAGYNVTIRDTSSDTYDIENAEQFFIGENGYLYVVYAYGNNEFTSEMDVIIFR